MPATIMMTRQSRKRPTYLWFLLNGVRIPA